ncbi:hypothetical protein KIN20_023184 [Parelaphostrongylus tenuis]|uniref:Uncharacterized protein n=1 Tax=Parelaphostrongylus tenuis TaxID=148309 RepID=A0AAD5QVR0_PARTN|nr:hypothetical protein KIN20_023184 [Parelaphostrongylus tenuis]
MTDGRKEQEGLPNNVNTHLEDHPNNMWACLWLPSTICICTWQRVRDQNHGMGLAYATMFEADNCLGRQLYQKITNGNYAWARTTRKDGSSKYSSKCNKLEFPQK